MGCHSLLQGISQPRVRTASCIAGRFFTVWATREAPGCESKGLVISLKSTSSAWVGLYFLQKNPKILSCISFEEEPGLRLSHLTVVSWLLLFCLCIPLCPWRATVGICPLEFRERLGGLRLIPTNKRRGRTEMICTWEAPARFQSTILPFFFNFISLALICCFSRSVPSNSFVNPWTIACQAPLSMGFSRQEYRSGLPFPPPGDHLDPEIELSAPASAGGFFTSEPPGKPLVFYFWLLLRLSLVTVRAGYSLLGCTGCSLRWLLLLQSKGSRFAAQLWLTGPKAPAQ